MKKCCREAEGGVKIPGKSGLGSLACRFGQGRAHAKIDLMTAQQPLTIQYFTEHLAEQLAASESRMMTLMRGGFNALNGRIDNLDERLGGVEHRLGKVEVAVEDLRDDVAAALQAIDRDALMIVDHERRIIRLEGTVIAA